MKIVIFGANSTVAENLAKLYANKGNDLVLVARQQDKLEILKKDLLVRGANSVELLVMDLVDFAAFNIKLNDFSSKHQDADVLFLAHGLLGEQRVDERSLENSKLIIDANFTSHALILTSFTNAFLDYQKTPSAKKQNIAVITSVAGLRGKQSNYIYGAAKAGMIAFVSGLRNRLYSSNIPVTDIRMGFVDTAMTRNMKKGALWAQPGPVAEQIALAIDKNKDVAFVPGIWRWIMLIIVHIPEFIFKRLKM